MAAESLLFITHQLLLCTLMFAGADFCLCENSSKLTTTNRLMKYISQYKTCDDRLINITMNEGSQQVVSTKQSLHLLWTDPSLVWDTRDYAGISVIYVSTKDICFPDIVLEQSLETFLLPPSDVTLDVRVSSSGSLVVYFPHTYRGFCKLDIARYPFDSQTCVMSFWSTLRSIDQLDLWPMEANGDLTDYSSNSEWKLIAFDAHRQVYNGTMLSFTGLQFVGVNYVLELERKPLFYIINLILPSTLVALLAIVGFFTPSESSAVRTEKVTLGITTLLSMAILILTLSTRLPVTSDVVPLTTIFFNSLLLLIAFGTFVATKSLQMLYLGQNFNKKVSPMVANVMLRSIGSALGFDFLSEYKAEMDQCGDPESKLGEQDNGDANKASDCGRKDREDDLSRTRDREDVVTVGGGCGYSEKFPDRKWLYITNVLDRLMFIVFLLLSLMLMVWFLSYY